MFVLLSCLALLAAFLLPCFCTWALTPALVGPFGGFAAFLISACVFSIIPCLLS
jgi:hypothetical protein